MLRLASDAKTRRLSDKHELPFLLLWVMILLCLQLLLLLSLLLLLEKRASDA